MEERRSKIKEKIENLRAEWKKTGNRGKRKIIEAQAKALKNALEVMNKKDIVEKTQEIFKL